MLGIKPSRGFVGKNGKLQLIATPNLRFIAVIALKVVKFGKNAVILFTRIAVSNGNFFHCTSREEAPH